MTSSERLTRRIDAISPRPVRIFTYKVFPGIRAFSFDLYKNGVKFGQSEGSYISPEYAAMLAQRQCDALEAVEVQEAAARQARQEAKP